MMIVTADLAPNNSTECHPHPSERKVPSVKVKALSSELPPEVPGENWIPNIAKDPGCEIESAKVLTRLTRSTNIQKFRGFVGLYN